MGSGVGVGGDGAQGWEQGFRPKRTAEAGDHHVGVS